MAATRFRFPGRLSSYDVVRSLAARGRTVEVASGLVNAEGPQQPCIKPITTTFVWEAAKTVK